ncbi:hypothetical protein VP06_07765 [Methylobacterium aquaticum]|uniref:Uncharacterized protein n=1 Tax=Methylobacterium aquaticum TaxID=270351 RepID=A0A0J6SQQ7_9HYPH|nr:hypothetical protein VP06_07765 [Methylobacterium aquaticum]
MVFRRFFESASQLLNLSDLRLDDAEILPGRGSSIIQHALKCPLLNSQEHESVEIVVEGSLCV